VICYDSDDAGRAGARIVARALRGVAASVRVCDLYPARDDGSDVTDFFVRDGGTAEAFTAALDAAPEYAPEQPSYSYSGYSDLENAKLFLALNAARLLNVAGEYFLYTGTHYERDRFGMVAHMAKRIPDVLRQLADEVPDGPERDKLRQAAKRSESRTAQQNMLALAATDPLIRVGPDALDRDPYLFNCLNGTLDTRTGERRTHDPADRISKIAPVAYEPDATAPLWDEFLHTMFAGNENIIAFLARYVGSMLTGETRDQKLVVLHGTGANGKSVFLDAVQYALGDYAAVTPFDTFAQRRDVGGPRNDLARLAGARCVISSEAGEGVRLDEPGIKSMTGADLMAARFLYGEYFEFRPQFKILLAANHKPVIRGTDLGIWRRVCLVPCTVTIPPEQQDPELAAKLRVEAPGILAWMVRGSLEWQRDGLQVPREVRAATAEYRADSDVIGQFIADCCDMGPDYSVPALDLYRAYHAWATERGQRPATNATFGRQLTDRGILTRRSNGVRRIGLRLKDAPAPNYLPPTQWTPDANAGGPEW